MFGGTFAAKGGIRPATRLEFELEDPVLKRKIGHSYDVIELPVLGRGCSPGKRSETRESGAVGPGFRFAHPGYELSRRKSGGTRKLDLQNLTT